MTKIMSLVKTRTGTTPEAFRQYWREAYLPSVLKLEGIKPGLAKVTHNHAFSLVIRADFPTPPWAGYSEMWFDRQADAEAFLNHPALPSLAASHADTLTEIVHLHCKEVPTWDLGVENPPLKMTAFFHTSATMDRVQSQNYWRDKHVPFGLSLNDPKKHAPRYVQNHILPDFHTANPDYDFAGSPELWFYSKESAFALFAGSGHVTELQADESKFSDRSRTISLMTDEQPVYERAVGLLQVAQGR